MIRTPTTSLYFESLEGFTQGLYDTVYVTYIGEISTEATIATLQGLTGALYYGLGRSKTTYYHSLTRDLSP